MNKSSTSDDPLSKIDQVDRKIINVILETGEFNLREIGNKVGISKSTVHNRLKRLKEIGFIKGLIPLIDQNMFRNYITAVSVIRAQYGPMYSDEIGEKIKNIEGIWALYYVLGENDFVALIRAKSRDDLEDILKKVSKIKGVERSNTLLVLSILKEDPRDAIRLE